MFERPGRLVVLAALWMLPACGNVEKSKPVTEESKPAGATRYALCAPIPAEHMGDWKAMLEEMKTKRDEHVASNKTAGIDQEIIFLQETPEGAAAVVYFEGSDLEHMMSRRGAAQDAHTQWFVSQITSIHHLPEKLDQLPTNAMVFQGDVTGIEGATQPFALAAPILPGKEAAHAAFVADLAGPRHAEWEASRRARGIAKEHVWNQKNPDGSTMTVVYFEVTDPANLSKPATSEFETWFGQQLLEIHGIPLDGPMPANTLAASF